MNKQERRKLLDSLVGKTIERVIENAEGRYEELSYVIWFTDKTAINVDADNAQNIPDVIITEFTI